MRLLPCGESGLLVEFGSLPEVLAFTAAAESARPDEVTDIVPGARAVLIRFEGPGPQRWSATEAAAWARGLPSAPAVASESAAVEIPVRYDGPDLDAVAGLTGLSTAEVVAAHTGAEWTCAFGGFAPGFGYLVGGDPRLHVPRRPTPRVRVPAGSVGLAGEFSGIYPQPSPGGWQVLGHTDAPLWDLARAQPALIRPGARVRFRAL